MKQLASSNWKERLEAVDEMTKVTALFYRDRQIGVFLFCFFIWDSLHARLKRPLRGMELRLKHTENLFRKNLQLKDDC